MPIIDVETGVVLQGGVGTVEGTGAEAISQAAALALNKNLRVKRVSELSEGLAPNNFVFGLFEAVRSFNAETGQGDYARD